MKNSTLILLICLTALLSLNAQTRLVNVPIDSDKFYNDISNYNNEVSYNYFPIYGVDEDLNDSSSLNVRFRNWVEISPEQIIGQENEYLTFSIKVKFEESSPENINYYDKAILFGQIDNIGLMFDQVSKTIFDTDSLLSYKVTNIEDWFSINLTYFEDSTVQLIVNDSIFEKEKRNSNYFLNNQSISIGSNIAGYLRAYVDSIEIITSENIVTNQSSTESPKLDYNIYPNPTEAIVFINNNTEAIWELYNLQGKLIIKQKSTSIDLSNQTPGVYILNVKSGGEMRTFRVVKK